jgi:hypothetical protein
MINAFTRAFQLGRLLPIVFWGVMSVASVYFWIVVPDYSLACKVLAVTDVLLFVLNVFARALFYFSRKVVR